MRIGVKMTFDAAHYLPNHEGKCRFLHGHTYTVEIWVEGDVQDNGMVMDLIELRKTLTRVLHILDHNVLNNILEVPTCENLVKWILEQLSTELQAKKIGCRIWEGDGGWAEDVIEKQ